MIDHLQSGIEDDGNTKKIATATPQRAPSKMPEQTRSLPRVPTTTRTSAASGIAKLKYSGSHKLVKLFPNESSEDMRSDHTLNG
ncbi:MAG: hypothetical protein WCD18_17080, partial [Thermosynechococcaceae cyanobacterium]